MANNIKSFRAIGSLAGWAHLCYYYYYYFSHYYYYYYHYHLQYSSQRRASMTIRADQIRRPPTGAPCRTHRRLMDGLAATGWSCTLYVASHGAYSESGPKSINQQSTSSFQLPASSSKQIIVGYIQSTISMGPIQWAEMSSIWSGTFILPNSLCSKLFRFAFWLAS